MSNRSERNRRIPVRPSHLRAAISARELLAERYRAEADR